MITTKSTYDELNEVVKKAYGPMNTRSYNYSKAHKRELIAACQQHPYFTPKHETPYKIDGITLRMVEVGVHLIKVDGEFRKKHNMRSNVKAVSFDLQEYLFYSIMNDLETNKKVLVDFCYSWERNECSNIVFYSTHAIQRYARRYFTDETLTFEETCSRLVRRSLSKGYLVEPTPYGTTNHLRATMFTADGMFFGYRDDKRRVFCMDTFITYDMAPKGVYDNITKGKEDMFKARDQIINNEYLEYKLGPTRHSGYTCIDGKLVEDGIEDDVSFADIDKDYLKEWKKAARAHYIKKMKRKGYT